MAPLDPTPVPRSGPWGRGGWAEEEKEQNDSRGGDKPKHQRPTRRAPAFRGRQGHLCKCQMKRGVWGLKGVCSVRSQALRSPPPMGVGRGRVNGRRLSVNRNFAVAEFRLTESAVSGCPGDRACHAHPPVCQSLRGQLDVKFCSTSNNQVAGASRPPEPCGALGVTRPRHALLGVTFKRQGQAEKAAAPGSSESDFMTELEMGENKQVFHPLQTAGLQWA